MSVKDDELWLEVYKLLVQLLIEEGRSFWERYSIFLGLNLGLLTAWTFLSTGQLTQLLKAGLTLLGILGLLSSLIWNFSGWRGRAYFKYWIETMKAIEKEKSLKIFMGMDDWLKNRVKWYEKVGRRWALVIPIVFSIVWPVVIAVIWIPSSHLANLLYIA